MYKIEECKNNKIPDSIVGVDIGIKSLVTLSDGTKTENNRYIKKYEKRIQKMQKELSRKEKSIWQESKMVFLSAENRKTKRKKSVFAGNASVRIW